MAPGRSRNPVSPGRVPVGEQVGELGPGPDEDLGVGRLLARRRDRRRALRAAASPAVVVEEDDELAEHVGREALFEDRRRCRRGRAG